MILLTLRGTPVLYYGDEIGMTQADVPRDRILDPVGLRDGERPAATAPAPRCRGATRRAPASPRPGSSRGCRSATWGATSPPSARTAARSCTSCATSSRCAAPRTRCARARTRRWRRRTGRGPTAAARRVAVALNLSDEPVTVPGVTGRVAVATDRARDGEALDGAVALGAWEGVVARRI